ncbi:MAG: P-type conjugative transfer protein TrbG [Rhodospirillales bacterium 69-11]|jgi:type IV secretion system protein VirB9|nr:MAG: P-type conjugative transfer protein TrbG [Rhodospirillales bacterium 69-11]
MKSFAILLTTVSALTVSACASGTPPPAITYDTASFKPAVQKSNPAPKPTVPQIAPGTIMGPVLPATPVKVKLMPPTARVEAANRTALHEPTATGYMNAVQIYPFSENALYRLYAAPLQVSDVALQPGEVLSAISAGDTVRWAVGDTSSGNGQDKQVHVLVKPFAPNLKTNLVILTNRRTYHLELQSTNHTAMAAVSWRYADNGLIGDKSGGTPTAAAGAVVDSGIAVDDLHFRYAISGDNPPWKPIRAFDDGHKVYIEFPARIDQGEAPPLFVVGPGGNSELVNYRMHGNYYVVDRLFGAAELRLGQDRQQVVRISRTDGQKASHGLFGG